MANDMSKTIPGHSAPTAGFEAPQLVRDFVAIHSGQSDVEKH